MYEVEVKVRAEHDSVRERLEAMDAQPLGTVVQTDTYYDAPHRDFAETDEALRVREEVVAGGGRSVELTYKGPLVEAESKTRDEAETQVEDEAAIRAILEGVGFEPAAEIRKERERWAVGDCVVSLDVVDGLGEYVEVEYGEGVDEAAVAEVREEVQGVLGELGLDPEEQIRTSYLSLLLDAGSPET